MTTTYYAYGMRSRGYSPGAQPKGVYERKDDLSGKYHDIIVYTSELSASAITAYELDFIGKEVKE